ncbi:MAG: thioredoxin-disulfide reductase [Lentisphaeria bacterium]|nr:thioredoxin-disulfide reductase [Lentisphaerota bacterium]MBR7145388.1 thioredoxin-disulfide reductase [Lentisphaeria bacterium]
MEKIVIIGSGPAGYTAAVYAARANLKPLIISGNTIGGLLTQTSEVENFPGFPAGINGYELTMKMQEQAEKFGARLEIAVVEKLELSNGGVQKITLDNGSVIETQALIIATGATPRWLGLESEERLKNCGVSACATCDGAFFEDMKVVVAGGGDSAMEEALFLTKFASEVIVVHRRNELRASKIMADRAMANEKIRFVWNSQIVEILGDSEVSGIKVRNNADNSESVIECQGVFVALGHVPATGLVKDQIELDESGFIKLQGGTSLTNLAGVFAAGDCADPRYRQAITAAGAGCRAAIDAERYLG